MTINDSYIEYEIKVGLNEVSYIIMHTYVNVI